MTIKKVVQSTIDSRIKTVQLAHISLYFRFFFIKRARRKTLLVGLWSQSSHKPLARAD